MLNAGSGPHFMPIRTDSTGRSRGQWRFWTCRWHTIWPADLAHFYYLDWRGYRDGSRQRGENRRFAVAYRRWRRGFPLLIAVSFPRLSLRNWSDCLDANPLTVPI